MRRLLHLLRTTILGGALFLAPVVILVIILGKAFQLTRAATEPVARWLPFESLIGLEAPRILAGLVLAGVCFGAGLLARTHQAKRLVGWLETALLSNLPGYSFMKTVGEEIAGNAPAAGHESVLVRFDDAWQLGFLVEHLDTGHVVVFVPGAPRPWDGDVFIVEESRVTLLSASSSVAVRCLQHLGKGSGRLVGTRLGVGTSKG